MIHVFFWEGYEKFDSVLFFFPGSDRYTVLSDNKFTYYSTHTPLVLRDDCDTPLDTTTTLKVNDLCGGYMEDTIENQPLCINVYMKDEGKLRLYGCATLFERMKRYDLINYALAEQEYQRFYYKSLGTVYYKSPEVDFVNNIPNFYSLQLKYYEDIENAKSVIDKIPYDLYASQMCFNMRHVTLNQCTRVFGNVFVPVPVKHIGVPKKPVFGDQPSIQDIIREGIKYIQSIGYTADYHLDNQKQIKTDSWKSMFIQQTGNCKDQALTMYQILASYGLKEYTLGMCSIVLLDGSEQGCHCVCVAINNQTKIPIVIDATLDNPDDLEDDGITPKQHNYKHVLTLFTATNTYWLISDGKYGVSIENFMMGKFKMKEKFHFKYNDDDVAYSYNLFL